MQGAALLGSIGWDLLTGPFQIVNQGREFREAIEKIHREVLPKLYKGESKLHRAINLLRNDSINQGIVFTRIMEQLDKIKPATFDIKAINPHRIKQIIAYQLSAVHEYGILMQIRSDWNNLKRTDPSLSKEAFTQWELNVLSLKDFSRPQLTQLIKLILDKDPR